MRIVFAHTRKRGRPDTPASALRFALPVHPPRPDCLSAAGGSSLGALAALVAGLDYPRVFGNIAAISPSVWWDGKAILRMVREWRTKVRPRVWLDCGTAEGNAPEQVVQDLRLLRQEMHD